MTKHLFRSAALGLCLLAGGVAQAAPIEDVSVLGKRSEDRLTARISYADLDLTSRHDRRQLVRRVRGGVREVCAPFSYSGQAIEHTSCRSFAWRGARPQLARAFSEAELAARTGSAATAVAIVIAAPAG